MFYLNVSCVHTFSISIQNQYELELDIRLLNIVQRMIGGFYPHCWCNIILTRARGESGGESGNETKFTNA